MKSLSSFFYSHFTKLTAIGITVITFSYLFLIMQPQVACAIDPLPEGESLLGVRFGYDSNAVRELFTSMNYDALQCYLASLTIWDVIFPILYTMMNIGLISILFKTTIQDIPKWWWINIFPFLQMILDFLENFLEAKMVHMWIENQEISEGLVHITSLITKTKWIVSGLIYILIFTGIYFSIRHIARTRKTRRS